MVVGGGKGKKKSASRFLVEATGETGERGLTVEFRDLVLHGRQSDAPRARTGGVQRSASRGFED